MILRFTLLLFLIIANPAVAQLQESRVLAIDGIQMEYVDIGAGSKTLVIESGIGMGLAYWQPLLADLSKLHIRTVIYSRAGNGKSQAAKDVNLAASNQRLEKLLTAINAKENLILIGHSFGGLHVRAFAAAHPERVKGLLLVDPSHELFDSELSKYDATWAERDRTRLNGMMKNQPEWDLLQGIYHQKMIADDNIANKIPVVIVTSSKLNESDWWIGHSVQGKKIWRDLHQSLIRNNANSIHMVTNQTGHNVPHENKLLLLSSVSALLELVNGV
ncbi:MAG: alpha/beta hydrolase [Gammaproteobacteria bacterium]|nr:alpha/beta hydrolase [Gammaproteobacteria bacterium]MBU2185937.1 alpha/beta hydrolase [Gammaproteobacteria bacterium]MBU2299046.1 alpha/beta hydrolase [Gammaproteobacteria bacterium]